MHTTGSMYARDLQPVLHYRTTLLLSWRGLQTVKARESHSQLLLHPFSCLSCTGCREICGVSPVPCAETQQDATSKAPSFPPAKENAPRLSIPCFSPPRVLQAKLQHKSSPVLKMTNINANHMEVSHLADDQAGLVRGLKVCLFYVATPLESLDSKYGSGSGSRS